MLVSTTTTYETAGHTPAPRPQRQAKDWLYSPLKIFHHQERLDQLRHGEQIVPLQVQLVISDLCNLNCSFCAYRMPGYTSNQLFGVVDSKSGSVNNNPSRMIPYTKTLEILDDFSEMGVKAVQFTGGGEPTVHPKHEDIFRAALDRQLDVGLVSNGVRLTSNTIELLLDAQWTRFSIDAATPESYSKIKGVSPKIFHKAWSNVELLVKRRAQAASDLIIGIGFVVTKENWHEVRECAQMAKALGVDNIRLSAVFQPDDAAYFKDFHAEASVLCKQCEELDDGRFRVFNLFGDRLSDLRQQSPDYSFCGYQQFTGYIGADLNVYRCCVHSYNKRGLLGSLANTRFKDFWFSEEKKRLIDKFDASLCERCQFNGKNRTILYAIGNNPSHVNFV